MTEPGVVRFTNTSTAEQDAEYGWRFNGASELLGEDPQGPVVRFPDRGGTFRIVLIVDDRYGSDREIINIDVPAVESPEEDAEADQ